MQVAVKVSIASDDLPAVVYVLRRSLRAARDIDRDVGVGFPIAHEDVVSTARKIISDNLNRIVDRYGVGLVAWQDGQIDGAVFEKIGTIARYVRTTPVIADHVSQRVDIESQRQRR